MDKVELDRLEEIFKQSGNWGRFRGEAGLLATFKEPVPHNYTNGDYLRGVLNGNRFEAFIGIWQDQEGVLVRDREFRPGMDLSQPYSCEDGIIKQILEKGECEFCYRVDPSLIAPQLAVSSRKLADIAINEIISGYVDDVLMYIEDSNDHYLWAECREAKEKIADLSGEHCVDCPEEGECAHRVEAA